MPAPFVLSSDLVSAYPAKSVTLADYIDGYKLDTGPVQNAQTGTSYTFALSDTTKTVTANNAAASAYTIPPQSSVVWEAYTVLRILNLGAGVVTLTAGAGVTLTGTVTVAQYANATLTRTASNAWTISGNASASGMDLISSASLSGASVLVTGCFSATYANYYVVVDAILSAANDIYVRLLNGSTPVSTSNYAWQMLRANNTTVIGFQTAVDTKWNLLTNSTSDAPVATMTLMKPFIATPTKGIINSAHGGLEVLTQGLNFPTSTSYDGIQFLPQSGTFTSGTARIYGLKNS